MRYASSRILGIYLVIISTLQLSLYACLYFRGAEYKDSLKYQVLDPRFFWSILELGSATKYVGCLTALWVLAIGISFILGRLPFTTYITSELILGIPQLLIALPWGLLMISEREGILTGFTPVLLVFFFTLVPMPWAIFLAIYGRSELIA